MRNLNIHLSRFSLVLLVGFFAFLLLPFAQVVDASTDYGFNKVEAATMGYGNGPIDYNTGYTPITNKFVILSDPANPNLRIKTVSDHILASYDITTGLTSGQVYDSSLLVLNDTYAAFAVIAITMPGTYPSVLLHVGTINLETGVVKSSTSTRYTSPTGSYSPTVCGGRIANLLLKAVNQVQIVFSWHYQGYNGENTNTRIETILYNTASNSFSAAISADIDNDPYIQYMGYIYVHANSGFTELYVVTSFGTTTEESTRPEYWIATIGGAWEKQAEHGTTYHFGITRNFHPLGGGVEWDGTTALVYWTWVYPYVVSSTRTYKIVQERIAYNTTISAGNILAQSSLSSTMNPNFGVKSTESWVVGYLQDLGNITLYGSSSSSGIDIVDKWTFTVTDWYNYIGAGMTLVTYQSNIATVPFLTPEDIVSRKWGSTYQSNEYTSSVYVYYGLGSMVASYDLGLTYTPVDSPLYTAKTYTFTVTSLKNTVPYQSNLAYYFDGTSQWVKKTDTLGRIIFTVPPQAQSGVHNLTFLLYLIGETTVTYDETFTYMWILGSGGSSPGFGVIVPNFVALIAYGLPALFIIFIPMLAIARIPGIPPVIAIMVGLTLGAIIGALTGLFPPYLVFLLLLGIGTVFVYMLTHGGGA